MISPASHPKRPLGHETYRFGPFRLDPHARGLYNGESVVHLTPRVFDIIWYFVEHPGKVIRKDELAQQIWGEAAVADDNISQHIFLARKALGDLAKPHRYVATVHGEGFRFVPEVESRSGYIRTAMQHHFGEVASYTAQHLCRSGRHFLNLRIESGNASAIEFFERAIETCRDLPEAYAGLAEAYWFRGHSFYAQPRESFAKAFEYARTALQLDGSCTDALIVQAALHFFARHDSSEAFRYLETAADVGTASLLLPILRVQMACARGEHERATLFAMDAMRKHPNSPEVALQLGIVLYYARDFETAARHLTSVLSLDPNLSFGRLYLGLSRLMLGDFAEARLQLARATQPEMTIVPRVLWPVQQTAAAALSLLEARCGDLRRAREVVPESFSVRSPYAQALCAAASGPDECYAALSDAIAQCDPWVAFLLVDPLFDEFRAHERFINLTQAVLLPKK